jgi:2-keto-3-deoxy-L-rhamnonate aldolase RhmA
MRSTASSLASRSGAAMDEHGLGLRRRLALRQPLGVFWMSTLSSAIIELAASAKPDAIVIDAQHGVWDRPAIEHAVGAVRHQISVLVRTAANNPLAIGQALDAGAEGVIVPMIETAKEAAAAVAAARFPPQGARSAGGVRALAGNFADYLTQANARTVVGLMIETERGVKNVRAIARTRGIDFVFIGTGDLALSLGFAPTSDQHKRACRRVFEACRAAKIPCAIYTENADAAIKRRREGYVLLVVSSDIDIVARGFTSAMTHYKTAAN